jgi:hypothetical protein
MRDLVILLVHVIVTLFRICGPGGIRIEENVVMTSAEGRILGKKRPRTIDEVETLRSSA